MAVTFEFATATRIVFGAGTASSAGEIVRGLGGRALLVTPAGTAAGERVRSALDGAGVDLLPLAVSGEPTVAAIVEGTAAARDAGVDVVVGCGGGSVVDTAKAIAAMLGNDDDLVDHLEVIGAGLPLRKPPLPWVAIPTTAGTGSEVTRNAVLASPEHHVKVSLRSPLMLARVALVDPELTHSLPPGMTASSGLDALTQLVEPFTSRRANPLVDALCRDGIRRASRSLMTAWEASHTGEPGADGRRAREDMSLAALFGGLALANAGLGAAHGFAAPIGGAFPAPHGAVCGRLLPPVIDVNVRALRARDPESSALERYDEVGRIVTGRADATAADAVRWATNLVDALDVPGLGSYGLGISDVPDLVTRAAEASSMKANPIALTPEELVEILERAL